jgi:hypothetical protein
MTMDMAITKCTHSSHTNTDPVCTLEFDCIRDTIDDEQSDTQGTTPPLGVRQY